MQGRVSRPRPIPRFLQEWVQVILATVLTAAGLAGPGLDPDLYTQVPTCKGSGYFSSSYI
jgi:hypothetical protein